MAAYRAGTAKLEAELASHLPWLVAFQEREKASCVNQLLRLSEAALASGKTQELWLELDFWEETAEAVALRLGEEEVEWLEEPEPVV